MRIGDLSFKDLARELSGRGIGFKAGPFVIQVQSTLNGMIECLGLLYADYPLVNENGFYDFHVNLTRPRNLRAWIRPQALFIFDGEIPFKPLPLGQAFALFEWGLNWCISNNAHQYLIVHAAALERDGKALIFPGPPGTGKSTLCAALASRGWRLLSDELLLLSLVDQRIAAIPRPISLKNDSIEIIRRFEPSTIIGPELADTAKGRVAHMRTPRDSVERAAETADSAWIVFPKYTASAPANLIPFPKGHAFMRSAQNAINYGLLGAPAFDLLADVIDRCACYEFGYGDLEEAIAVFDALATRSSHQTADRLRHD